MTAHYVRIWSNQVHVLNMYLENFITRFLSYEKYTCTCNKVFQVIYIKKERKLTDKARECMPGQQSGWGCDQTRCLSSACIYESSKDILSMIFFPFPEILPRL